jgi:hypothetical protein
MSLKTRFVAFATAVVAAGALSAGVTSAASAAECPAGTLLCKQIENFEVSGTLTAKKLNQTITLPSGGTFNGFVALSSFVPIAGSLDGVVAVPAFEAPVKLFGLTTKVGLTFTSPEAKGSLTGVPAGTGNCANNPAGLCVNEKIPTSATIGFTSITLFGLKLPLHCKTASAVSLPLEENLLLFEELLNPAVGSHFTGTTSFPPVSCNFFEEPFTALYNSALLTSLFSGPGNNYSLFVKA